MNKAELINRRRFIQGLLLAGATPALAEAFWFKKGPRPHYISAAGDSKDKYGLNWVSADAKTHNGLLSGFRGHSVSQHPFRKQSILMFGRRPATRCIEIDVENVELMHNIKSATDRHFFGHGVFSADGKTLFTTENDYHSGRGKIGIRDATNYQQIGEYESHGTGPHELRLMPDGKTLVIANSGILTHPDSGRKKLNLNSMDSTLTYIDSASGKLLGHYRFTEPKASIRHIDVSENGTVAIAMQHQRDAMNHQNTIALGALHQGGDIQALDQPEQVVSAMNDYMGSVAINPFSQIAGFTSPRGNLAAFWYLQDGQFVGYHQLHDVCGICLSADKQSFVLSNSRGQIRHLDAHNLQEKRPQRIQLDHVRWDNHLTTAIL